MDNGRLVKWIMAGWQKWTGDKIGVRRGDVKMAQMFDGLEI